MRCMGAGTPGGNPQRLLVWPARSGEEVKNLASGLSTTTTELCDFRQVPQPALAQCPGFPESALPERQHSGHSLGKSALVRVSSALSRAV